MQKQVAVVILNWNGAEMMRHFLPSVVANSPEAEIVVADNGSTDDSVAMLRHEFPAVRIIELDKNYGFAEGYNKALENIEPPYSILLNSDVEVTPGWIEPMIQYMEVHPETAACQPKILSEKQRGLFEYAGACGGYMDALGYPFCRGRILNTVEEDRNQYDTIASVFWASGAALMIRTEVFKKEGGLDGRFFAHMEEIDLCWRLKSRGWNIACIPQSVVYHVGGATLNKSNPRKTYLNFRNNMLMIYKNASSERVGAILKWRMLLDYLAAAQMMLTLKWRDAAAVCKARKEFKRIKSEFEPSRQENMRKTTCRDIPEMMQGSILWHYYIKGRHCFSRLRQQ